MMYEPGPERVPILEAVIAGIGLGEARELARREVERAAVDDHAADRRAVTADELGGRMHDDVAAPLERTDQPRCGHRVVEDERDAVAVRDVGDAFDVEHVIAWVADGLAVDRLGVRLDGLGPLVEVVGVVDERDVDPHLGQRVVEEVVRTAVERGRRHDVVARSGEVQDGEGLGRLAGRDRERTGYADRRVRRALE